MQNVQPGNVVEVLGRFGLYHALVLTVAILRAIPIAWTYMMSPLMAPEVPHQCAPPPRLNETIWKSFAQPEECTAFPLASIFNGTHFHQPSISGLRQPCEFGWTYEMEHFGSTATSEWDLVCGHSWMRSGLQATIMAGSFSGVTLFGKLADAFGRKSTFYAGVLVAATAGVVGAFVPTLLWFNICRFVVAGCAAGLTAAIVTLFIEIMPNTDRVLMNVGFGIGYVVPLVLIGFLSWALQNFRMMQLALGLSFLLVVPFYPFVEESPKWLLAKGRTTEAARCITRILCRNKRPIPSMVLTMNRLMAHQRQQRTNESELTLKDLLKLPATRANLASIFTLWFCESVTYYHIMLNAHKFPGNPQLNYALSASAEIPAAFIGIWVCRYIGRRVSQTVPIIVSVASFALILLLLPSSLMWPNLLAMMWIRFLLKSQNFTQWIAVHENFPTPVRSTGFAFCHMFSRCGATVAPFIVDLGRATHSAIPHSIFFASAALECYCLYRLPETLNEPLPDTLEELENICQKGKSKKSIFNKL
ncbi:solute carrier family 22 member 6-B-like [Tropilaelaps mercedesae]|uniref:Solute carrier family 22 member 6-B-like n=1 Tax=Tropilaelaps mercedesae TaxID=418985 RepID=A0A1V9X5L1_9ACAR|nr:solute carrier family 22 member 6-B-like [Tropilaelaps mercedesae]